MVTTVIKTIGSSGVFSTLQLWEDGAPADLTTAEKSAAATFAVAAFIQGESLTFVGSGATGKLLDTDSTGAGTGTYVTYDITTGNPAASDVVTGGTSGATCVLSSSTPIDVGVIWQGQCQNQEFNGTGIQLSIGGSVSSVTCYKELTTVTGASFRDHANKLTNPLRYDAAMGASIRGTTNATPTVSLTAGEEFVRMSKLQVTGVGTNARAIVGDTDNGFFDYLICEGTYTATLASQGVFRIGISTVRNCAIIQRASAASHIVGTATLSSKFYNCTIVASDDLAVAPTSIFLSGATGVVIVHNCGLFAGDSTKAIQIDTGASFTFTTCYSDISGTGGVTQTPYSGEYENINDATRDFRLKVGALQIDTGTTDITNAANDIIGTSRPSGAAYDIGAWEYVQEVPVLGQTLRVVQSGLRW